MDAEILIRAGSILGSMLIIGLLAYDLGKEKGKSDAVREIMALLEEEKKKNG
jgi:hypothetical protein